MQPYVCAVCKKRINKVLQITDWNVYHTHLDIMKQLKKKYADKIKEIAIVEDEVNDFQLVDKDFIDAYDATYGHLFDSLNKSST